MRFKNFKLKAIIRGTFTSIFTIIINPKKKSLKKNNYNAYILQPPIALVDAPDIETDAAAAAELAAAAAATAAA